MCTVSLQHQRRIQFVYARYKHSWSYKRIDFIHCSLELQQDNIDLLDPQSKEQHKIISTHKEHAVMWNSWESLKLLSINQKILELIINIPNIPHPASLLGRCRLNESPDYCPQQFLLWQQEYLGLPSPRHVVSASDHLYHSTKTSKPVNRCSPF